MAALLGNQHDSGGKKKPAAPTAGSSDGSLNSSVFQSAWGLGGKQWVDCGGSGLENPVFPGCKGQKLRRSLRLAGVCRWKDSAEGLGVSFPGEHLQGGGPW